MRTAGVADQRGAKRPKGRKAQIALTAAQLFCEQGYHNVGVDEIAAAVGISGPAVYRHFPNKYAILVQAVRELADAVLAASDRGDRPAGAADQLDGQLGAIARLAVDRRRVGALYQSGWRHLAAEDRAEFRAGLDTVVGRLAAPLRRLRSELAPAPAGALILAALSVLGSFTTHRAAIPKGRAEEVLRRAAWAVLRADAPGLRPPTAAPDPAAPVPPPVRMGSRREIVLSEAIRLFHELGYHAVGMEQIGRAAGINASSVYRYFPSKGDLLAAAYYRASERLVGGTTAALAGAADPADALHRLVVSYVDITFEHSDLVSVYLTENTNLPGPHRHELRKLQRLHVEEWVRLACGVRPDLPVQEARVLVHAAINMVSDLGRAVRFERRGGADRDLVALVSTVLAA